VDKTGNSLHPTQKPLRPLEDIIRSLSAPGDVVFDPFCGSGSSLAAAKRCGRGFLGIESTLITI
jgi:site-specific DNA-methyltransferase (adenine-specific)